jgi:hypothetical protein
MINRTCVFISIRHNEWDFSGMYLVCKNHHLNILVQDRSLGLDRCSNFKKIVLCMVYTVILCFNMVRCTDLMSIVLKFIHSSMPPQDTTDKEDQVLFIFKCE